DQVYRRCDPAQFGFCSTEELEGLDWVLGQERALRAVEFGVGIRRDGYNLFVMGLTSSGRHSTMKSFLERRAAGEGKPDDWVYVNNFEQQHKPLAMRLPSGRASELHNEMRRLLEEISSAIPAAFETDEYRTRREAIENEFKEKQEDAFGEIQEEARKRSLALIRTPMGLALAPVHDDEVMPPEEFRKLPPPVREQIEKDIEELQQRLQQTVQQVPDWDRERRRLVRELNREITSAAVSRLIATVRKTFEGLDNVLAHLERVERDIIDNAEQFLRTEAQRQEQTLIAPDHRRAGLPPIARRYEVNVVIGDGEGQGAPVISEPLPSYSNLLGRVEHQAEMGALTTDFTLIKPGALHAANGGYLVIDALKLLQQPYAWEGLKRALRTRTIRIESVGQMLSLISTVSLEPEPIPLDAKVVLIGDRRLYYLLCHYDPEFTDLFKVEVDFEDDMARDEAAIGDFARLMSTLVRHHELRHLAPDGVARVLEHAARLAGNGEKLSLQIGRLSDLLKEADFFAGRDGHPLIGRADVQQAIDGQIARADRISRRMQEAIVEDTILIDTDGEQAGQINGLAVFDLGTSMFGKPSRITARVRMGTGEVLDIERRSELGGPLHTKGVMILSSYLGARYAGEHPLSLSASLVFEQSYAGVDGDSASSAELYALLSALAKLPIRQQFAVTGSVNQYGKVQAIGGVNEKIEGFFDVCKARGLTGRQGVLIPVANVRHLMLRPDVADAIGEGRFHVNPIRTIDEGIELLTGVPAGEADAEGRYPEGSVNRRVADRMLALANQRRSFVKEAGTDLSAPPERAPGPGPTPPPEPPPPPPPDGDGPGDGPGGGGER
ncbi:MAG TPA: ATP-binding protein, partial [Alphaproteobacteria bacterium]|nr:ATP-binding protein [Alphaproteobacteria bacterium]